MFVIAKRVSLWDITIEHLSYCVESLMVLTVQPHFSFQELNHKAKITNPILFLFKFG